MPQLVSSPSLPVGQVVTVPDHHGRESGMIGRIAAIEQTEFGAMYRVKVPASFGERSIPVLARLLDYLEGRATAVDASELHSRMLCD